MAGDLEQLLVDLQAETAELDGIVPQDPAALATPTPAEGWTVADTVGHLWFFDREATVALTDPDRFVAGLDEVLSDPAGYMARHLQAGRALGTDLMPTWRRERIRMIAAARSADPGAKVPWYGPPMSPMSFLTARLMETWAHGQDVADALHVTRTPTDRLRHVCHLGVRTRGFSYAVRGATPPAAEVYVDLLSPGGQHWTWGDDSLRDRVEGPALDFCLLVTQRRHLDDLDLRVTGSAAADWMSVAQAFAGEPSLTDAARRRSG